MQALMEKGGKWIRPALHFKNKPPAVKPAPSISFLGIGDQEKRYLYGLFGFRKVNELLNDRHNFLTFSCQPFSERSYPKRALIPQHQHLGGEM